MIRRVAKLGVRTLDGNRLRLVNRTNDTVIVLTRTQTARWREYFLTGRVIRRTPVR